MARDSPFSKELLSRKEPFDSPRLLISRDSQELLSGGAFCFTRSASFERNDFLATCPFFLARLSLFGGISNSAKTWLSVSFFDLESFFSGAPHKILHERAS